MSLVVTAEQQGMAEALRAFLEEAAPPAEVRRIMESPDGVHRDLWRGLATELGLAGALAPEEHGGAGLGPAELVLLMEEAGRVPVGLPLLSTAVLATGCLTSVADPRSRAELLPALASGDTIATVAFGAHDPDEHGHLHATGEHESGGWRLSGDVDFVLDGHVADLILTVADTPDGARLFAVDADAAGLRRRRHDMVDLTRPLAALAFDRVPARPVSGTGVTEPLGHLWDVAALAVAAEQVGGATRCLEMSVAHATTREQFGRPVGSFQAVKHLCADLLRTVEPARAAVRAAARAGDPVAVSVAKAHGARVYLDAASSAMQIHGGLGYSWEHDAHLHYKRAQTDASLFGSADRHRARLAEHLTTPSSPAPIPPPQDTEDHGALRAEARAWIAAHREAAVPIGGAHPPHAHTDDPDTGARDRRWLDLLREGRWLCLSWPVAYGGRGLPEPACLAVNEEFARAGALRPRLGMGETLLAPALLAHGTDEQKRRLLPRILSGQDVYCQGFSEPEAGSDLARLRTRGVLDGDELVINGHKIWTSGAAQANMMFLLCRTDPDAERHRGLSYVVAAMPGNGFDVRPIRQAAGGAGFCEEYITDARAPLDNVIGGLGEGWRVAMTTLGAERAGEVTTQHLGYRAEFDRLVERLAAQGRLADPLVRDRLAELFIGVRLMRCTGQRVADELRAGNPVDALLAIDKVNWSEFHCTFGTEAMDLQGLAGLVRPAGPGYPVDEPQRAFLESRGRRIARGTNQIQRIIIAERVLGLPK